MVFLIKTILIAVVALIIIIDVMFNRKRKNILKFFEICFFVVIILYIFMSISNYVTIKNEVLYSKVKANSESFAKINKNIDNNGFFHNFVYKVFDGNTNITYEKYIKNNITIIVISGIIFVYWLALLLLYERETAIGYKKVEDKILFDKYNPMLAACIAQNRNVMCRDIVAIVLSLIDKGKINITLVPDKTVKDVGYRYMISENLKSKVKLDLLEEYVYDWIFEDVPFVEKGIEVTYCVSRNKQGIIEIDLIKRISEISESQETYNKILGLNRIAKKKLNSLGANIDSVPFRLRVFNNLLIVVSLCLAINNIIQNGISVVLTNIDFLYYIFICVLAIAIFPITYIISLICFKFIKTLLKSMQQMMEGYTGRKLISKSISIIFSTCVLMISCAVLAKDFYIVYDILLLGVTCLVIFTDNHMLKHDPRILNDYYNLKRIEDKIIDYSLIKEKNVEYIKLWNTYYSYAVALGISLPVEQGIDIPYKNSKIITQRDLSGIYTVCKAYLKVIWDEEVYDKFMMRKLW